MKKKKLNKNRKTKTAAIFKINSSSTKQNVAVKLSRVNVIAAIIAVCRITSNIYVIIHKRYYSNVQLVLIIKHSLVISYES